MPTYLAPGVYVEEVPASNRPIAGVGTSTAGFIQVAADDCQHATGRHRHGRNRHGDDRG